MYTYVRHTWQCKKELFPGLNFKHKCNATYPSTLSSEISSCFIKNECKDGNLEKNSRPVILCKRKQTT